MDNESAKSMQPIHNITSNYSNQSSSEISTGNQSVPAAEAIDKVRLESRSFKMLDMFAGLHK